MPWCPKLRVAPIASLTVASLVALLLASSPPERKAQAGPAAGAAERLVVFEVFHSTLCASCAVSGRHVDVLATDYAAAGAPVLFLEHDVDRPAGNRLDRWFDAHGTAPCGVPLVLVDSGWRETCGERDDYRTDYAALVDEALAHPATATIRASFERQDTDVVVTAEVTNGNPHALGFEDWATVKALVFERARVVHTNRIVRAVAHTEIVADLMPGATGSYTVRLPEVPVTDWGQAGVLVILDHRSDPDGERFAALQSALAVEGGLEPTPAPTPQLDAGRALLPLVVRGPGAR